MVEIKTILKFYDAVIVPAASASAVIVILAIVLFTWITKSRVLVYEHNTLIVWFEVMLLAPVFMSNIWKVVGSFKKYAEGGMIK